MFISWLKQRFAVPLFVVKNKIIIHWNFIGLQFSTLSQCRTLVQWVQRVDLWEDLFIMVARSKGLVATSGSRRPERRQDHVQAHQHGPGADSCASQARSVAQVVRDLVSETAASHPHRHYHKNGGGARYELSA